MNRTGDSPGRRRVPPAAGVIPPQTPPTAGTDGILGNRRGTRRTDGEHDRKRRRAGDRSGPPVQRRWRGPDPLASAHDALGREEEAAGLYRRALAAGLPGGRRRRAVIQLASTLRNLGRTEESVTLLTAERDLRSDELDDAVAAFLSLALADAGREREAVALALTALVPHLPEYRRSLTHYARARADGGTASDTVRSAVPGPLSAHPRAASGS
ncbi:tetratricopeptide repeat protein [Streptomyces verrucosisporus]|uniref:tetratricopeptide repeat protein n=1 Tax=Streptomyces verrucosisporus TaxID=1695161 RepID=UPI0019D12780|nr:tetratricopeptide repeat protein [Streptomyces verrucosisporus]MBN3929337.1 tetratricopeptide repeat protein [Streptomyces verrucosisporus]